MDDFMSDTMRQLRKDHPEIKWDDEPAVSPQATAAPAQEQRPPVSRYGAMIRLLSSKGKDFEPELDRFTNLSSPETRAEGRRRARESLGYREKARGQGGE